MAGVIGRLLIVSELQDYARRLSATAERLGYATRILQHTLDLDYVMQHWHPDIVALQVPMSDEQDAEVLKYLRQANLPARLVLIGDTKDMKRVASEVQGLDLVVASALATSSSPEEIEDKLKQLHVLEDAA